jgi:hypothetical protein
MEKSYFGFEPHVTLGEVVGTLSPIASNHGLVYTACNESVLVWDLRTRSVLKRLTFASVPVTCLTAKKGIVAIGY